MRLTRRLLSVTAAGGLAVAGLAIAAPTHASAISQVCGDNNSAANWSGRYGATDDIPILGGPYSLDPASPITLGIELSTDTGPHAAICYATGAVGGAVAVDAITVPNTNSWSNGNSNTVNLLCAGDGGVLVAPNCEVGTKPTIGYSPAVAPATGGTYTVSIPFTVCFGTTLTGGCSPSVNGPVNVGSTGVIVAAITTGAPQGTDTGGGLQLNQGTLWVAGIPIPIASVGGASAGVGSQSVEAHPNNLTPLCVLNGYCPSVPAGAGAAFTGTQDVYSISVAGFSSTYAPSYYCIVDIPPGTQSNPC